MYKPVVQWVLFPHGVCVPVCLIAWSNTRFVYRQCHLLFVQCDWVRGIEWKAAAATAACKRNEPKERVNEWTSARSVLFGLSHVQFVMFPRSTFIRNKYGVECGLCAIGLIVCSIYLLCCFVNVCVGIVFQEELLFYTSFFFCRC